MHPNTEHVEGPASNQCCMQSQLLNVFFIIIIIIIIIIIDCGVCFFCHILLIKHGCPSVFKVADSCGY